MIAMMSPTCFRAFYRMNRPEYMRAMKNPNGNEMHEQKATDSISESLQAGQVMYAYLNGDEFNPMTLVYFYPEMRNRIERGEELFRMATGMNGATTMSGEEFKHLIKMVDESGDWCLTNRLEKARRVIRALKQRGYQCRLTPEGLNAGMDKMKYWLQGPGDYLDFTLAFHSALATVESDIGVAGEKSS